MKRNVPTAPRTLSPESRTLWRSILTDYELDDSGRTILEHSLEALDRMRQAQALLKADGLMLLDRFGAKKPHPAILIERDCRAAVLRGLTALGLDLEPIRAAAGRPAGGE